MGRLYQSAIEIGHNRPGGAKNIPGDRSSDLAYPIAPRGTSIVITFYQ